MKRKYGNFDTEGYREHQSKGYLPLRGTREPLLNRVLIIKKAMNLILHMDLSRVRGRTMVTDPRRDCYHMRSSTVFSTVHVVIHLGSSRIYHMRSVNIQSNEPFTLIPFSKHGSMLLPQVNYIVNSLSATPRGLMVTKAGKT